MRIITIIMICFFWSINVSYAQEKNYIHDTEQLVSDAKYSLKRILNNPNQTDGVKDEIKKAYGVMIVPAIYKAGLFFGLETGTGVFLAKADNGQWSYPAFYTISSASFGLQLGVSRSELLLIVRTKKGVSAILNDNIKIGGDLSAAVGPYGSGIEASTTRNLSADIYTYSIVEGAFIGVSVEGSLLVSRDKYNNTYYNGKNIEAEDVIINGLYSNPQADDLRIELDRVSN